MKKCAFTITAGKRSKRIVMNSAERAERLRKFRAIEPLLEYRIYKSRGEQPIFELASGERISRMDDLVAHIAWQNRISKDTLYRWYQNFVESSYSWMFHRRSDDGVSRYFSSHKELEDLVLRYYRPLRSGEYPAVLSIHNFLVESSTASGVKVPCYRTLLLYCEHLKFRRSKGRVIPFK
jgi:hypothetical protein